MGDAFFGPVESRRSIYKLANSSPISDDRINEIISNTVKHTPSSFNIQSARAVILLREHHEKLWDIGDVILKETMPENVYAALAPKVAGLRAAYGTVLWLEDEASLDVLRQKNPGIQHVIGEWSDHSSGMYQFVAWSWRAWDATCNTITTVTSLPVASRRPGTCLDRGN